MQIFDEKENELREELLYLKIQIQKGKIIEDVIVSQMQEEEVRTRNLEAKFITLRKKLNMEKSIVALDIFLEN